MGEMKSDLAASLRKSVAFLRERYPQGHPLLDSLELQLKSLMARKEELPAESGDEELPLENSCCERHESCPFFQEVEKRNDMDDVLKEYVNVYCCGPARQVCFRLKHAQRHGSMPLDNISPTGDEF